MASSVVMPYSLAAIPYTVQALEACNSAHPLQQACIISPSSPVGVMHWPQHRSADTRVLELQVPKEVVNSRGALLLMLVVLIFLHGSGGSGPPHSPGEAMGAEFP